jgi:hypothetical protein
MSIKVEASSAPESFWTYGRGKNLFPRPDFEIRTVQSVPRSLHLLRSPGLRILTFYVMDFSVEMPNNFVGRQVSEEHATSLLRVGPTVKMEVAYDSETVLSTFNTTMYPKPEHHKMHSLHCGNLMTYPVFWFITFVLQLVNETVTLNTCMPVLRSNARYIPTTVVISGN